jgi:hypothetical protein
VGNSYCGIIVGNSYLWAILIVGNSYIANSYLLTFILCGQRYFLFRSSLPRQTFVQLAQLFDPANTQQVQWREFVLVLIFALLPKVSSVVLFCFFSSATTFLPFQGHVD